jgi:glycine cleavage system H protein
MIYPDNAKYTKDHEWVRPVDGVYAVGITAYAAEQLGDVTFVELPPVDSEFGQGDEAAAVESVKAAGEVYAPITGRVTEVNGELEARPELVNEAPHAEGWFFKMESDGAEFGALMDAATYETFVAGLDA